MTYKEIGESVLRSIESHLRDNPMSHDSCEPEDNFAREQLENASEAPRSAPPPEVNSVLGALLPDLFAGEIAAMGRLLVKMSAALSRRALSEQAVLLRCRDAANELRAQAILLAGRCTKGVNHGDTWNSYPGPDVKNLSDLLIDLSVSLTEAAESLDERH